MDPSTIDLYDPDRWVDEVPHEAFAWLRRNDPVFWQELPEGRGYWALTTHADVMAASADPATYSAARGGIVIEDPTAEGLLLQRTQLLSMDPPEHNQMRRHVLSCFTPSLIGAMEGWLRERTVELLDAVSGRDSVEFVGDVAARLPLQVIAEMLGVPEGERARMSTLTDAIIGRDDPELGLSPDEVNDAAVQLGTLGFEIATRRTGSAGGELMQRLLDAEFEGHKVTEVEFAGLFVQIAVGGNETTRSLLAGTLLALMENPDAWRDLCADADLIPTAIEEMLRWTTPVHYFRRTAMRDVDLHGKSIREGDRVVLYYCSANRDEDVFDEPFRFDIRRDPNPQLAFGWGQHFCLGARLARLETRVFFEEFFRRFGGAELVGSVRRTRSNLNNAYKEIPVCLKPR
jgi:cytochrome P450